MAEPSEGISKEHTDTFRSTTSKIVNDREDVHAHGDRHAPSEWKFISPMTATVVSKRMSGKAQRALLCVFVTMTSSTGSFSASRDPLRQPFSSQSIWNMPIGAAANYVDPKFPLDRMGASTKLTKLDEEIIVLRPSAPLTPVHLNTAGWTGRDRCKPQGQILAELPVPDDLVVNSSGENSSAAILQSDGRTVVQLQPFTRCRPGGPATALVVFSAIDLYGSGTTGAHGGSNLSALGGSLRLGELRPHGPPPVHALKMLVDAQYVLFPCKHVQQCFRWPASTADGYAIGRYGSRNRSAPAAMKMGALLAIPQDLELASLNLETAPGKKLSWTLQNYGAYVVDDSFGDGFGFAAEKGPDGSFARQFRQDYGFEFVARTGDDTPWSRDARKLIGVLRIVDNNGPVTTGGGGTPLQPLAAELTNR